MDKLGVSLAEEQEIIAELASHLEDLYEQQLATGCGESEAVERALGELTEWRRLARGIRRATREEDEMNNRTKTLWLPGLISLAGSMAWMWILQGALPQPEMRLNHAGLPLLYQLLWLATSPLIGAASALLSRRWGGGRTTALAAALSPSIVMIPLWVGLATRMNHPSPRQWFNLFCGVLNWIVVPGVALLLGALPFLRASRLQER
jgi:hypothetical protein